MKKNSKYGLNIESYGNLELLSTDEVIAIEGGESLFYKIAEGVGYVAGAVVGGVVYVGVALIAATVNTAKQIVNENNYGSSVAA
jgi:hypothetical protein